LMLRRAVRILATIAMLVIVTAALVWGVLAIWFDGPHSRIIAAPLAALLALVSIALAALLRPFLRGLVVALFPVIVVALWWTSIPASNTRDWTPDVSRTARATFSGNRVTIENVRNFNYRSET